MMLVDGSSPRESALVIGNSARPEGTQRNRENVQAVSKHSRRRKKKKWPKTDSRHWQARLFKNTFTRDGERRETSDWCVKIGHLGRRETFNLGSPNLEAAGSRALAIYRMIVG